tara:strand:- start:416 stop:793 length:378 start_codon:yes stop_codon:yes gene_type:complete
MKLLFENWRQYTTETLSYKTSKKELPPTSDIFDVITLDDLKEPYRFKGTLDDKLSWKNEMIRQLFTQGFEQAKEGMAEKDEKKMKGALFVLRDMSGGELDFKNAQEALQYYIDNELDKVYRKHIK